MHNGGVKYSGWDSSLSTICCYMVVWKAEARPGNTPMRAQKRDRYLEATYVRVGMNLNLLSCICHRVRLRQLLAIEDSYSILILRRLSFCCVPRRCLTAKCRQLQQPESSSWEPSGRPIRAQKWDWCFRGHVTGPKAFQSHQRSQAGSRRLQSIEARPTLVELYSLGSTHQMFSFTLMSTQWKRHVDAWAIVMSMSHFFHWLCSSRRMIQEFHCRGWPSLMLS